MDTNYVPPSERRYKAVNDALTDLLDSANDYSVRAGITRADAVAEVNTLRKLGRSPRWANALDLWCEWLADETNDFGWAIRQGAIQAGHAAE